LNGGEGVTLEEIKNSEKEMLTPADICGVLGVAQYTINVQVKRDKQSGLNSFPFPTILIGTRVKIPRKAFIKAMEGDI
jgi:hypothetical protein